MDWTRQTDGYCERIGPDFWAEPVNALTNAAFLVAAALMWRRTQGLPLARTLCLVLAAIGVGSFLFHTLARAWAALADVVPIAVFIPLYLYAANRGFWRMPVWLALVVTGLFVPYSALLIPWLEQVPWVAISAAYWPVPILIAAYAAALAIRAPATASGLATGALLLVISLLLRSADLRLCQQLPLGTHFAWHLLNALMLGWMIEVYRRHALEGARSAR